MGRRPLTLLLASTLVGALIVGGAVVAMNNHHGAAHTPSAPDSSRAIPVNLADRLAPTQELATVMSQHKAHSRPSANTPMRGLLRARTTITEERTVVPVVAQHEGWLKVELPGRPNGHTGWISRSGTKLSLSHWHLVLDVSQRTVTVLHAGKRVKAFKAVVGKASTPTPRGDFYVEESVALSRTEMGAPLALALSARSDVFQHFAGGPGQIALHGLRNVGGVPGTAVSHGCIRLTTPAIRWLVAHIAPGVPVTITN
jgi:lipoprotein-anchoring transpeptidase ErfK/SrfK